jgi:superfamily II DNA/RNA helicase
MLGADNLSPATLQAFDNRLPIDLPDRLADAERHAQETDADIAVYEEIAALTRQMSNARETAKARLLTTLIEKHQLLLAFDSRPITLAYLRQTIGNPTGVRCQLVWGDGGGASRDKLLRTYAHGSSESGVISLCSDSVAEGVNLQQASALVHLDMPSVVRIAEQRVGRVDRLDSPHDRIEAWWPRDAPEFG